MGRYDPRDSRYAVSLLACHSGRAEVYGKMSGRNRYVRALDVSPGFGGFFGRVSRCYTEVGLVRWSEGFFGGSKT